MIILRLIVKNFQKNSNFAGFRSKVGIVVLRDIGSFDFLMMLLLEIEELLILASC